MRIGGEDRSLEVTECFGERMGPGVGVGVFWVGFRNCVG